MLFYWLVSLLVESVIKIEKITGSILYQKVTTGTKISEIPKFYCKIFLRKINIEGMSRDYKTKMKYFESEPQELKKRYAAIGVHNYEYKR